jgi:hypothetical protein
VLAEQEHHFRAAEHAKLAGDPETVGILTKQLITPGVKGLDWCCGISVRNESIHAPLHLFCSTIGERKCQDLFWRGALLGNQPCNSSSDDLRLPSASPSDDKERAFAMRDRCVLFVIEIGKKVFDPLLKCPRCAHRDSSPYRDLITLR